MKQKHLSTAEIKYIIKTLFVSENIQSSVFDVKGFTPRGVAKAKKYTFSSNDFSITYNKWVVEDIENITNTNVRGYTSDGKLTGPLQINFPNRPTLYFVGEEANDIANFCEQYAQNMFSMSSIKDDYQR
ncbi:MAG: hypothetical protein IKZ49_04710 [Alphaproteobacteria bacterium]|nr:hypothetical protein [Alphaproteobacteria bacterium]